MAIDDKHHGSQVVGNSFLEARGQAAAPREQGDADFHDVALSELLPAVVDGHRAVVAGPDSPSSPLFHKSALQVVCVIGLVRQHVDAV